MSVAKRLKHLVPETMKGIVANCGGTNRRGDRFAGNLLNRDLSDEQFTGIMHALIFPNGVRKTTMRGRNAGLLERLLDRGDLVLPDRPLRVLDVGASGGLDAITTFHLLQKRSRVEEYVLGDLHTHVLYDQRRGLVFDVDGNLLQVRRGGGFVATNFEYNFAFQRIINLPKRLRPWLLERRHGRTPPSSDVIAIPLVHPSLRIGEASSPFRLERLDVFRTVHGSWDLIVCMHLLVERYFSAGAIERGTRNLAGALAAGGHLLVGALERHRLLMRDASGMLVEKRISRA
jgi:hypothetical protein